MPGHYLPVALAQQARRTPGPQRVVPPDSRTLASGQSSESLYLFQIHISGLFGMMCGCGNLFQNTLVIVIKEPFITD